MSSTAFISIGDLQRGRPAVSQILQAVASDGCSTRGGDGKASCGSSDGPGDMPAEIWEKVKDHPCCSEEAHQHFARMHVAVAPAWNIQCNYCNRKYDFRNESRPGVVSQRLTPEQAVKTVVAVASEMPQMTVLGIARPGDALADEVEDVCALLLEHVHPAAGSAPEALAVACPGDNHLWQDLQFASRAGLSAPMRHWFPTPVARNHQDMKWKKFLYKQLCEREQLFICRAPSCAVCSDRGLCSEPETAT